MRKVVLFLFLMLGSFAALAQSGVTVSGTTQDQTGAVIPNEAVTLTNKAGQALKTQSDGEGRFSFSNVAPGEYVLRAKAKSFKAAEVPITVHAKAVNSVVLSLPVGDADETVSVNAGASQPSSAENNADAVQVNTDMINSLPLQGQDVLPLLSNFLSPAAQGAGGLSVVVDGVEGTDLSIPTDSIKRININKNPYSPEFRRPGLGRIEVATRNGSRGHFDGSFATYIRNDALDATNAFANKKPPLDRKLFEATLGGPFPIRHARFFVSASRLADDESAVTNAITPQGLLIQNVPTTLTTTNLLGRVDLRPNDANTVSLLYNYFSRPGDDRGVGGIRLPSFQSSRDDRRHKGQIIYTKVISPSVLNVARFNVEHRDERDGFFPAASELDVEGSFIGGINQTAQAVHETKLEFQDVLSYTHGMNNWRVGGAFRPHHYAVTDASNFGGVFTFPTLAAFNANNPNLFQVAQGSPNVSFSQNEFYSFIQDDIRLGQHVSLMAGLRYDWQQRLHDSNNFGPRVALGFSPGNGSTVFRIGSGMFFDHLPDSVTSTTLLLDGANGREFVVRNPAFPTASLAGLSPSVWILSPNVQTPYLIQSSASVDQTLWKSLRATVEYQHLHGVHLFRARDINAPLANGIRPNPALFLDRQVESTASLKSNSLIFSLQGRVAKAIKLKTQYTFSNSKDDTDGPLVLPADSRNLAAEWGRSDFNIRHRFTLAGTSDLPHNFRIGTLFTAQSGLPFNITTGVDNNNNGVVNDRPAGVVRNSGNSPDFVQLDLRLSKTFYIFGGEKSTKDGDTPSFTRLEFSFDAFNALNHSNFTNVIGVVTSSRFGLPTAALQPRTLQVSAKIVFRGNRE